MMDFVHQVNHQFFVFIFRKKIRTTSAYIFETLFKKGVNSDVTISALGKLFSFPLTKLILLEG